MNDSSQRMLWVDLEMTGLDPAEATIVEIATIITESDLSIVAEGPEFVIHQPDEVLAGMDDFVRDMHTRSGLLERIRASTTTMADAAAQTVAFVAQHCAPNTAPLCGNSVWKDRAFLERYMPEILRFLHYRIVDVSSIKELARRWYPSAMQAPKKKETHRALLDVRESIEELLFYKKTLFIPSP